MEKEFVSKMKDLLLQMKQEILENLMSENEEFKEIAESEGAKDLVDIASSDIDKRILSTLGSNDVRTLNLIDSALARIENGKYGYCLKTGKAIPKERLEAIPYALYCIEYQNELERKNR